MSILKSITMVVSALALGGIAIAAPARDDSTNRNVRSGDPQLDRAAVYRTTNIGECGAVKRQVLTQTPRERDAKRARDERRKTLATASCDVVWSD